MSAALWCYVLLSCFVHSLGSQGPAVLTFNSSAPYSGESVTLTCSYGFGVTLMSVRVEAYESTHQVGNLWCSISSSNTTGTGVFSGHIVNGCPVLTAGASSVSIILTAASSLELKYNCSATVLDDRNVTVTVSSPFASLSILDLPTMPTIQNRFMVYKENDAVTVECESHNGKPAAAMRLTVTDSKGTEAAAIGDDHVFLTLPPPVTHWQNATVLCNVTNHKFPGMTVRTGVEITYIMKDCNPATVDTSGGNATLDCTTCVRSYPSASYSWSAQTDADVTNSFVITGSSTYTVLKGQSGMFFCIATNPITMKSIILAFTTSAVKDSGCPCCQLCWALFSVLSVIVVITIVILGILYKRRQLLTKSCLAKLSEKQKSETVATERKSSVNPPQRDTTKARTASQRTSGQLSKNPSLTDIEDYENFEQP